MKSYDVSFCSEFIIDSSMSKQFNSNRNHGTTGEFITPTPKLQTVAEKFSNVFDSPIIEFYHMNPCGFLFLYLIFSLPLISRNVDYILKTKIWIFMLCIHTISILCRVPKLYTEISGNVDLRIGFAQLACNLVL